MTPDPFKRGVAVLGLEDPVADMRQDRAFYPCQCPYPQLVGNHRNAAEVAELAKQRRGACDMGRKAGDLDPVDRNGLGINMNAAVRRHHHLEPVHDLEEILARDLP